MGRDEKTKPTDLVVSGTDVDLDFVRTPFSGRVAVSVPDSVIEAMTLSHDVLRAALSDNRPVYGANTAVGKGAGNVLTGESQNEFQSRLVVSHMVGVDEPLSDGVVRASLLLKVLCLAQGYSGVRPAVLQRLVDLINNDCLPVVPSRGSVGASGDLAPLAHIAGAVMGVGDVRLDGVRTNAADALAKIGLAPLRLGPKEGAALLNGTQVSTAQGLLGLFCSEAVFNAGLVAGALSLFALEGQEEVLDERVHRLRRQRGQIRAAEALRDILGTAASRPGGYEWNGVQSPYSIRCQPQVMGAALDLLWQGADMLLREANGVTDNPLLFAQDGAIINGGNFHAEPVAYAADIIALAACEVGSLSERRIALLVDGRRSGLPDHLVVGDGLDSGFKTAHVTASALVAENRALATPCSVDSIPTSAGGQDHVSMSAYAALRLTRIAKNVAYIVAIELLAAAQALDLRKRQAKARRADEAYQLIRSCSAHLTQDRALAGDIESVCNLIMDDRFGPLAGVSVGDRR